MNEQKYFCPDISDPRGEGIVVNTEKGDYIYYPNGELVSASTNESFGGEFATGDIVLFNGKKHIVKVINGLDCEIQPIFEMGLIKCPLSSLTHLYFNTSRLKDIDKYKEVSNTDGLKSTVWAVGRSKASTSKMDEHYSVGYEDNAPITQEFIESFGFKYCASARERFVILYELRYNYTHGFSCFDSLFLEERNGRFSMYYGFQIGKQQYEYIFRDYTCTTQSELRFLLTKGRIDCSK